MTTGINDQQRGTAEFTSQLQVRPVTFPRVVKSEFVKLRSLRSTWITLVLGSVAMVAIGGIIGFLTNHDWAHLRKGELARFDPVMQSLTGVQFAQLAFGVLGVLFVTGEYGTGMIRSSFGAVPRRLPVLWAKAVVFGAVTLVLMTVAALSGFFLGQATLSSHGTTLAAAGAVRAVLGTALYVTVVGLLGVGLGFIVRSTAGGIAALFGVLLVLPGVISILPQTWQDHITAYLPSVAGSALWDLHPETGTLAPWTGFAVFGGYAVLTLVIGGILLRRRDA